MKKIFDDLGPPAATADLRKEYDALMTRARDLGAAERGPTTDDPRAARPAHTPRTTGTAPQTGDKWVDSGVAHLAKAAGISPEQYMKMKAQQLKLAPDDPKAAEKLAAAVRADVQAVQTELGAAGHPAGRYGPKKDGVDAKWGPATENAFAALRRAKGVSPTIEAIRAAAEGRPPAELGSSTEVTPPKGTVVTPPGRAAPVTRDVVSHLTFDVERLATLDLTRVGLSDTTMVTPELVASGRPVGITGMPVAGASPEEFSPMAIAAASERVAAAGSKLEWKEASLAAPVSPEAVAAGLPAKGPKGRSEMAI